MSRSTPPRQAYAYTTHSPIPPNYYYEEQEGYVGDYTESDGLSERSHHLAPNGNEIYRKKQAQVAPTQERYRQSMYMPPNYYYETIPTVVPQQMRRPAVPPPTYRRHIPVVDERTRYYTATSLEEAFRENVVYSSPHIAAVPRASPHPTSAPVTTRPPIRRHPVTVRTPRYVRRANGPKVFKKPSALCLPLACERDPAVYRKNRKNPDEPNSQQLYGQQMVPQLPLERTHSLPMQSYTSDMQPVPQTSNYQKNVHMTQSDLDAVLARYETVFEDNIPESGTDKCDSISSRSSINVKPSKQKFHGNLKPKVPASIRQKQIRSQKQTQRGASSMATSTKSKLTANNHVEHLEVEQITTDVLDSMLSDLMKNGCENKINEQKQEQATPQSTPKKSEQGDNISNVQRPKTANPKGDGNLLSKSFTYKDMCQSMSKSRAESYKTESNQSSKKEEPLSTTKLDKSATPKIQAPSTSLSSSSQQCSPCAHCPLTIIDDNGVMELHRSKSYIVNLIDRALSKELGTAIPEERYPTSQKEACIASKSTKLSSNSLLNQSEQVHTRRAMGLINKHVDKMDKGLCLEITQTLTDSLISNATAPSERETKQHETTCSCNVQDNQDEPLYIKQLRQLRWGHLRHIQREVRRLEDLERFLDSCSTGLPK